MMKRFFLLLLGLIILGWGALVYRNELTVMFDSQAFYKPLFTGDLDITTSGASVRAILKPSYDVRHGFFLVFPCDDIGSGVYNKLDGAIKYSLFSEGIELHSETMSLPERPMKGQGSDGICDIVLFTFDLPFKGHETVTLEVTVVSPMTKLASLQSKVQCEVAPAYWPK